MYSERRDSQEGNVERQARAQIYLPPATRQCLAIDMPITNQFL
jgi:hypothetical protein